MSSHVDSQSQSDQVVAIIGMSCRFPDANSPDEFWRNLCDGHESIREFTDAEIVRAGGDPGNRQRLDFVPIGVILDGIDEFDVRMFGYSPRDAEILDPQHRKFLECAWEALEDAGYIPDECKASVGVFAGADLPDYMLRVLANEELTTAVGRFAIALANDKDYLATRVAYALNLKGPAITIQTACSTSLVAVSQACQSLLTYQCDMALAGGAAISASQGSGYFWKEGGISSPDGRCRTFDAHAQGTVSGSGVGIVALKRLDQAVADGDHIYALIRGFGVNNDGRDKIGFTAPSISGQTEAILTGILMADVSADSITYIECHGTATPLGDPIEIAALTQAFRTQTERTQFCGIGSVKTNIGHLSAAAGVAGLIKTALALKNRMLPASLHFETSNPEINFSNSPFFVVDKRRKWDNGDIPLRAGVSSFGIGGTNAHVVLEEAPNVVSEQPRRGWHLLPVAAMTKSSLERATEQLRQHVEQIEPEELADTAFTLQVGRKVFPERRIFLASTAKCGDVYPTGNDTSLTLLERTLPHGRRSVVFMFPGQGAQHIGMARVLYESELEFRRQLDACCDILRRETNIDLIRLLYSGNMNSDDNAALLQTRIAQPALFCIEYALARLWMGWGVLPDAMIGHSVGEFVAACLAGVFSVEDAISLVATRGELMQAMRPGAMLIVYCPESVISSLIEVAGVTVAASNGPASCVLSGSHEQIGKLEARLATNSVEHRRLVTSHAFHSPMMNEAADCFLNEISHISLQRPVKRFISNRSGTWITPEEATSPQYWAEHIRKTVKFGDGIATLIRDGHDTFLEVGPGQTLKKLTEHCVPEGDSLVLASLAPANGHGSDEKTLMQALGTLWVNGVDIEWKALYRDERRRRVSLPTYPFERRKYWISATPDTRAASTPEYKATNKRNLLHDWFYIPRWQPEFLPQQDKPVLPCSWLVVSEAGSPSNRVFQKLSEEGHQVTTVCTKGTESADSVADYFVDLLRQTAYADLCEQLIRDNRIPDKIVFWCHPEASTLTDNSKPELVNVTPTFFTLLYLVQALSRTLDSKQTELIVVTTGGYAVSPDDTSIPENSMLSGACRVISQEHSSIHSRIIDVPTPDAMDDELLLALLSELRSGDKQTVVALRETGRWVPKFEQVHSSPQSSQRFHRKHGVYLVTGGLGGIGYALAKQIAGWGQPKIVLTTRTRIPDRSMWPALLSEPTESGLRTKIRRFLELEETGAEIVIRSLDVTDRSAMRELHDEILGRFGKVDGIIHAAGVPGGGIIDLKTAEAASRIMDVKVRGTQIVHDLFAGDDPDFMLLCSSLSSLFGGIGQIDYCAANCYMDAFAHRHTTARTTVISVNWDVWRDIGMAAENPTVSVSNDLIQDDAFSYAIHQDEGQSALDFILSIGGPQVAVSTTCLLEKIQEAKQPLVVELPAASCPVECNHDREGLSTEYVAPRTQVEASIASIWTRLLGHSPIGIYDDFLESGGHSLLAIQLLSILREHFLGRISVADFYENPTVAGLASRLNTGVAAQENHLPRARNRIEAHSLGSFWEKSFDRVLPIRQTGELPPLFCVHPVGGLAWCYARLSLELSQQRPIFGLQADGLKQDGSLPQSISEIAQTYIDSIRSLQTDGPYHLLGWSFGGIVAHEIACQLQSIGADVAILTLLDSFPHDPSGDEPGALQELATLFNPDAKSRYCGGLSVTQQELSAARDKWPEYSTLPDVDLTRLIAALKHNTHLVVEFTPQRFEGDIVFFKAAHSSRSRDVLKSWQPYVAGDIVVHNIDATHETMADPEPLRTIASILEPRLQTAQIHPVQSKDFP